MQAAYFFAWPALGVATILIMQPSEDSMKRVRSRALPTCCCFLCETQHNGGMQVVR